MGSLHAREFADAAGAGQISLEAALSWHLGSNHYPPVPASMVPVCIQAIEAGNDRDWDREIELPEGCSWRGQGTAPAHAIIEGHHLESFLGEDGDPSEDEDEDDVCRTCGDPDCHRPEGHLTAEDYEPYDQHFDR